MDSEHPVSAAAVDAAPFTDSVPIEIPSSTGATDVSDGPTVLVAVDLGVNRK
jgi:hypothetical protein